MCFVYYKYIFSLNYNSEAIYVRTSYIIYRNSINPPIVHGNDCCVSASLHHCCAHTCGVCVSAYYALIAITHIASNGKCRWCSVDVLFAQQTSVTIKYYTHVLYSMLYHAIFRCYYYCCLKQNNNNKKMIHVRVRVILEMEYNTQKFAFTKEMCYFWMLQMLAISGIWVM